MLEVLGADGDLQQFQLEWGGVQGYVTRLSRESKATVVLTMVQGWSAGLRSQWEGV